MNAPVPRDTEIRVHPCIAAIWVNGKGFRDFSHVNRTVHFLESAEFFAHTSLRVWACKVVLAQMRYLLKFFLEGVRG